jgi:hypothetical protein
LEWLAEAEHGRAISTSLLSSGSSALSCTQASLCVLVAIFQVFIPIQGLCILGSDEDQVWVDARAAVLSHEGRAVSALVV